MKKIIAIVCILFLQTGLSFDAGGNAVGYEVIEDKIEFKAILPPIDSAIQIHGQGGSRIKFDVAENDMIEVLKLSKLKGKVFKVIIPLKLIEID